MKKVLVIVLTLILAFSGLVISKVEAAQFSDVPSNHRFYNDVQYLTEKGVISPSGSKFGVDQKITREEVAVMVSKAVGLNGKQTSTKFKDVPSSLTSSGYINSAVKAGIIAGFPDGTFRPKEIVTRGQMAIFLSRAFKLTEEANTNFKDMSPSVSSYKNVRHIVKAGITTGYPDNTYRPNETLSRGQIVAFLSRALFLKESGNKQMKVHFIDVGQGDSILLQTPTGKNMLIDGGKASSENKVVAFLKSKGISTLDVVIATHPDADHIGGLISVLETFKVNQFIDSGKVHTTQTYFDMLSIIDKKNIPFKLVTSNEAIALDSLVKIKILYADKNASDSNDASIVTKVSYGSVSFLLTGDAGIKTEKALLGNPDLKSTYLKAGHHGSATSSSDSFVKAVSPEGTILSYGEGNSYGHPAATAVNTLKAVGTKIYSTAVSGDITVSTNGVTHSVSVKPWYAPVVKPAPAPVKPKPTPVKPKPTPVKPKPTPAKPNPGSGSYVIPGAPKSFQNCTAMKKYYPNGVKKGHPAYATKHDRDKDGWACE
ncbi:S-layer homology domain-containing protein [Sporosarcina aquimarina]|uniref:S-layer homology domain-containing protein n=1 Tax=Sporosarcina aquimarina TaxID=114975 RepID=A0ABU4G483_9BACL|nr:S-layer homology domain-containing protein [Sporosarcina aquimarina]MDW0111128.1 S-layer homology domain-containing protein [Sporosarcina aquimarina]